MNIRIFPVGGLPRIDERQRHMVQVNLINPHVRNSRFFTAETQRARSGNGVFLIDPQITQITQIREKYRLPERLGMLLT
jgi:hypothetical protein